MEISKTNGANMIMKITEGFTFEPLVEGLIEEKSIGMIVGPAKSRKSMLALNLCFSLMSKEPFLGCNVQDKKRKILYINLELTREALGLRLRTMRQHYSVSLSTLDNLAFWGIDDFIGDDVLIDTKTGIVNKQKFDQLIAAVNKWNDCDLIVIDPLYYIVGEENDNAMVTSVLKQLSRVRAKTGAAIAVVHHCKKERVDWSDPFQAGRGASSIGGFFEWVIGIQPDKNSDTATIHHGSRNLKSKPSFSVAFDDSDLVWKDTNEKTKIDLVDKIMGDEISMLLTDFVIAAKKHGLPKWRADKLIESNSDKIERVKGCRGKKTIVKRK